MPLNREISLYRRRQHLTFTAALDTFQFIHCVVELALEPFASTTGQYIRLRALSEINGNFWISAAEINVLGQ